MEDNRVNGMIIKHPHENAPSFVKCGISIKVEEFVNYLRANDNNGWVNLDMKKSKDGKLYVSLNDWKPKEHSKPVEYNNGGGFEDDIPF